MKPVFSYFTPGTKIAWLFICLLAGIIMASLSTNLILMIPAMASGGKLTAIYVGTIMQSVLATALPAYIVAGMTHPSPSRYLKMVGHDRIGEKITFAVLAFIFSYVLAFFLSQWNKGMVFPAFMHELEQTFRSMEDAALETTGMILSRKTVGSLLLNLIVVAGFAAVSEEMFYRGALQQFIQEKFSNGHVSVWITALIFSIVHFQFYGFLPRLLLGALLGYLFLYTRNLWIPILFHFINNAFIVIAHYFWSDREWMRQVEEWTINGWFLLAAAISAICTVLLFWGYSKKSKKF